MHSILQWLLIWTGGANGNSPQYLELSGFIPDLTMLAVVSTIVHHLVSKNCHKKGCWSIFTAPDPDHNWPACKKHHSKADVIG